MLLTDNIHDRKLIAHVRPVDWVNPTVPSTPYHLAILGGGPAGLVAASFAAGLGVRVALIEAQLLGGDCLNHGCVPSKALLHTARIAATLNTAPSHGLILPGGVEINFPVVMDRMRRLRAHIAPHDSAARFRDLGVDVFLGRGTFSSPNHIRVGEQSLQFKHAIIATGTRPRIPDIPGVTTETCLTNESIFNLTERPARLAILGAGPIGCELAQCFQRLGSQVTLVHRGPRILEREDPMASDVLEESMAADGVTIQLNTKVLRITHHGATHQLYLSSIPANQAPARHPSVADSTQVLEVDAILIATGRTPNVDQLNLDGIGIDFTKDAGITVNDLLQTSLPHIYACGDVCLLDRFTHAADFSARIAVQNALLRIGPFGSARVSRLNIPRCTYSDPEVAHVGLLESDPRAIALGATSVVQPLDRVDRAITDDTSRGFVKIVVPSGSDKILGATIVGAHAGESIGEIALAMAAGVGLKTLGNVIHPYPTLAEAIRRCGDLYRRAHFSPRMQHWVRTFLHWRHR